MTQTGKLVFFLLVLTLFARVAVACELVGSYVLRWEQTHGDQPFNGGGLDIAAAGPEPRPDLEGVQATAATDCLVDFVGSQSRYMLPFDRMMYASLGWSEFFESKYLSCKWNDLFFMCSKTSGLAVSFDCPGGVGGDTLSSLAKQLCSVRKTEQETFSTKSVTFGGALTYFGAVGFMGLFSLERVIK